MIVHRNYLDIPIAKRAEAAAKARAQMRALLATPGLSAEQVKDIQERMTKLTAWEKGTLPVAPFKAGMSRGFPLGTAKLPPRPSAKAK